MHNALICLLLIGLAACQSRGGATEGDTADLAAPPRDDGGSAADLFAPDLAGCGPREVRAGAACVPCSVLVPQDQATLAAAIAAAPSPGVVCVGPGSYREALTLRPHVSLRGAGVATRIEGNLSLRNLSDADPTPTVIADLTIRFAAIAALTGCPADQPACAGTNGIENNGKTFALLVERVFFDGDETTGTLHCAQLETYGGNMNVTVRDSRCRGERGLRLRADPGAGSPFLGSFLIERNRFEPAPTRTWTYDSVEILLYSPDSPALPAGSKATAVLRNNEFLRSRSGAIYLVPSLQLAAADQAAARIRIINNSFVSDDGQSAVWDNGVAGRFPLQVSANNLFYGMSQPRRGRAPEVTAADQTVPGGGASPFVDLVTGDLHLAPGAAAIDAGDPAYAPPDDKDGLPRPAAGTGRPDVGAHERQAPPS